MAEGKRQLSKLIETFVIQPSDAALLLGLVAIWFLHNKTPMRALTLAKRAEHRLPPASVKKVVRILLQSESLSHIGDGLQPGPAWVDGSAQAEVDRLLASGW
jgi:hypothetical protein